MGGCARPSLSRPLRFSLSCSRPLSFLSLLSSLQAIEASRAIFIPNIHDASPRVASEALALDVPVLVNAHIRGGWKYATPASGAHFTSATDVVAAWDALEAARRAGTLRPRAFFSEAYGQRNAAVLFEAFLEVVVGRERMEAAAKVGKLV